MTEQTARRVCPICDGHSEKVHEINLLPISTVSLSNNYSIMNCEQCGFCFDNFDLTNNQILEYYSKTQKYVVPETAGSGELTIFDRKRYEYIFSKAEPFINKDSFILDYGCAKGGFIKFLREKGYKNVFGFEPSIANSSGVNRQESDIYIYIYIYNSISDLAKNKLSFDMVFSMHVLEHVYDFEEYFTNMRSVMKDEGYVALEVPNASTYKNYSYGSFYGFDIEHINHFTPKTLKHICKHFDLQEVSGTKYSASIEVIKDFQAGVCGGVFQKSKNLEKLYPYDEEGIKAIQEYLQISADNDNYSYLSNLKSPVVLWGVGAYARRILEEHNCLNKFDIIIDRNLAGETLNGVNIVNKDILNEPQYQEATVVVSSVLYQFEILEYLKSIEFKGTIINIACHQKNV